MSKDRECELIERYDEIPCPTCNSSDSMTIYKKRYLDGDCEEFYDGLCWSTCRAESGSGYKSNNFIAENKCLDVDVSRLKTTKNNSKDQTSLVEEIKGYDSRGVKERKILKKFANMYDMKVGYDQETGEIDTHYYPVTKKGKGVTGYCVRTLPKSFMTVGDVKDGQLQGQHLFEKGGKYYGNINHKFIIITEGFLDTLAAQQMLQQHNPKYLTPVVSLPLGANLRAVSNNADFLDKFETILLAFDQDEAGLLNAQKCSQIFEKGKCKIMTYSLKDPCEMLKRDGEKTDTGKRDTVKEFASKMWSAVEHKPSQILTVDDIFERAMKIPEMGLSFPWVTATEKTLGIRKAEIHIVGAAPKIG